VVWLVTLGPVAAAVAGTTRGGPPVKLVPPVAAPVAPAVGPLEPDDLPAPQPEVAHHDAVDLPTIPDFQLAVTEPGFRAPRELQVRGKRLLGTELKVKGYVTWIYDCAAALASANPQISPPRLRSAIDSDPALCEYPKLYLGDTKNTPRSASLWVVDMPRAPTRQERVMLAKDELKAWPVLPRLAVGDYVVITGTWAQQSPHAEHNSGGLLVYKAVELAAPSAPPAASEPADRELAAEPLVVAAPPLRKAVDASLRDVSIQHLNACNQAIAAKRYEAAIPACQAATRAWDGNHLAWYATASAYMARGAWRDAAETIDRAVALRPDQAMYQLYRGISHYELARLQAREELAARRGPRPDEGAIDVPPSKLDAARDALQRAIRLGPELWRAHYYLGRIHRDLDEDRAAAEQFTLAVKTNPGYRFGYIALVELYRRWGYVDQSLVVAALGAMHVPAADAADLWLEIGMAYDAKASDDKAIAALGKAIAIAPDNASAKLQRGRIYFRKGDTANARRDLEDVVRSTDERADTAKQLAAQMLARLAGESSASAVGRTTCNGPTPCRVMAAPYSGWGQDNPVTRM